MFLRNLQAVMAEKLMMPRGKCCFIYRSNCIIFEARQDCDCCLIWLFAQWHGLWRWILQSLCQMWYLCFTWKYLKWGKKSCTANPSISRPWGQNLPCAVSKASASVFSRDAWTIAGLVHPVLQRPDYSTVSLVVYLFVGVQQVVSLYFFLTIQLGFCACAFSHSLTEFFSPSTPLFV